MDPQARYEHALAEFAAHEAVRSAEQVVGALWISDLLEAEQDALASVRACAHLRDSAGVTLRTAQEAGEPARIVDAHHELASLERALADSRAHYGDVRELVAVELEQWAAATRVRVAESLEDRSGVARAQEAANAVASDERDGD